MERVPYNMSSLFDQLGVVSDEQSIARFINGKAPLGGDVQLHEAAFWTASQAEFLREAVLQDAEWVVIVDALNSELHARH
ncbi:MAG: hypothetical protein RLZZ415_1518 [Pseudomonadota bacterium]